MINDLKTVRSKDLKPCPMDWKILPESTPNGMSKIKKHKICNASAIFGPKTELSAEYEKIYDNGSANMKKNEHIKAVEIKPSLIP